MRPTPGARARCLDRRLRPTGAPLRSIRSLNWRPRPQGTPPCWHQGDFATNWQPPFLPEHAGPRSRARSLRRERVANGSAG
eukprot:15430414-Alexandrium_andersonii.AAC.1